MRNTDIARLEMERRPGARSTGGWLVPLVLSLLSLFLLLLIAGAVVGAGIFLSQTDFLRSTYPLTVHCEDALGLPMGAPVNMNGVRIGSVAGSQVDTHSGNQAALLHLKIRKEYSIPAAARFVVTPPLASGPGTVSIHLPPEGEKDSTDMLRPGSNDITAERVIDPARLLDRLDRLVQRVDGTLERSDQLLAEAVPAARTASGLIRSAASPAARREGAQTIADLRETIHNTQTITGQMNRLLQAAGTQPVRDLATMSHRMAIATGDLQAMVHTTRAAAPSLISQTRRTIDATERTLTTTQQLMTTTQQLITSANQLTMQGGRLLDTETIDGMHRTLQRMGEITDSLAVTTKRLETVSGAAENLASDTTVQTDLKETLHNMRAITDRTPDLLDSLEKMTAQSVSLLEKLNAAAEKAQQATGKGGGKGGGKQNSSGGRGATQGSDTHGGGQSGQGNTP